MKKIKSFTLIELLVVVAIIGILAAVGTPIFQGFIQDAKIATVQKNFNEFVKFMQIQMVRCEISETIRLNASKGWRNEQCPKNAWEMAWKMKNHFQYENWMMLYPGEWYASPRRGSDFKYAVHVRNDHAGKKICDRNNYAGYICMEMIRGRSETIVIWSITTNDQSTPNRLLSKTITWKR